MMMPLKESELICSDAWSYLLITLGPGAGALPLRLGKGVIFGHSGDSGHPVKINSCGQSN